MRVADFKLCLHLKKPRMNWTKKTRMKMRRMRTNLKMRRRISMILMTILIGIFLLDLAFSPLFQLSQEFFFDWRQLLWT